MPVFQLHIKGQTGNQVLGTGILEYKSGWFVCKMEYEIFQYHRETNIVYQNNRM